MKAKVYGFLLCLTNTVQSELRVPFMEKFYDILVKSNQI